MGVPLVLGGGISAVLGSSTLLSTEFTCELWWLGLVIGFEITVIWCLLWKGKGNGFYHWAFVAVPLVLGGGISAVIGSPDLLSTEFTCELWWLGLVIGAGITVVLLSCIL